MRMEFSKITVIASVLSSFVLSGIVIYCTFAGVECSSLTTVCCLAWAETAASNASYFAKAKKENLPKTVMGIYRGLPEELRTQVDINSLMQNLNS